MFSTSVERCCNLREVCRKVPEGGGVCNRCSMTSTDGLLLSQFHNESYEFRRPVRLAIHRNRIAAGTSDFRTALLFGDDPTCLKEGNRDDATRRCLSSVAIESITLPRTTCAVWFPSGLYHSETVRQTRLQAFVEARRLALHSLAASNNRVSMTSDNRSIFG